MDEAVVPRTNRLYRSPSVSKHHPEQMREMQLSRLAGHQCQARWVLARQHQVPTNSDSPCQSPRNIDTQQDFPLQSLIHAICVNWVWATLAAPVLELVLCGCIHQRVSFGCQDLDTTNSFAVSITTKTLSYKPSYQPSSMIWFVRNSIEAMRGPNCNSSPWRSGNFSIGGIFILYLF